jgi:hypothetical protein
MDDAREAAQKARAGKPVGPLTLLGLEVVAIRADPAEVRPANTEAARSETYLALRDQTQLMYLGRSGSTLVLLRSRQSEQLEHSRSRVHGQNVQMRHERHTQGLDLHGLTPRDARGAHVETLLLGNRQPPASGSTRAAHCSPGRGAPFRVLTRRLRTSREAALRLGCSPRMEGITLAAAS